MESYHSRFFYDRWSKKAEKSVGKLINDCNCFTAGTKVKTDQGEKNIEDIHVGDQQIEST